MSSQFASEPDVESLPLGMSPRAPSPAAHVNGVPLHADGQQLDAATLRQRACSELLRQAAQKAGLLAADDEPGLDGVPSEAASLAIEALLEQSLAQPEPDEAACRRHHAAYASRYCTGARVRARHILFAVTPGVDVAALRKRAESTLIEARCRDDADEDRFAALARQQSNCPSGAEGGDLGWLVAADCAPEFAREIFGQAEVGVLPRLVHSRFGLHVVEVLEREAGVAQPFESVRGAVTAALRKQAYVTALRQYLQVLAGGSVLEGTSLEAAASPLVQ